MPSTKGTARGKPSQRKGAKQSGKGQLLISRFFSSKPKADSTPTRNATPVACSKESKDPSDLKDRRKASAYSPAQQEPDTPATRVTTPRESENFPSPPSPNGNVREDSVSAPRKRRRLFVQRDDDDDDDDVLDGVNLEPQRKAARRAGGDNDPDFAADTDSEDDDISGGGSIVNSEEELEASEDVEIVRNPSKVPSQSGTNLASYGHTGRQGSTAGPLPRDAARKRRFTQKIGRLEKNSFFLRQTGGGGDGERLAEPEKRRKKAVTYTPLESQFVALRKKHPDKLLVVECGYKYRMFDEDASVASKILRVAAYFDHNFLTASFPTHRLVHHVRRLVQAGHKVGVVSQTETAALKKASDKASKLFERKVTSVYTKGTISADGRLASPDHGGGKGLSRSASYIMSIMEFENDPNHDPKVQTRRLAMAAVDSATGEVLFDSFTDDVLRSDLESRLAALEPVEILVSNEKSSRQTELVLKSYCDNMSARLERVQAFSFERKDELGDLNLTVEKQHKDGKLASDAVLCCLGALTEYLQQFELQLCMTNAMEFKSFRSRREMKIGADVLRNFEVFGNSNNGSIEGSLIGLLNRTKTPFGSRQMKQWISHPLAQPEEIIDRLDAVEYLRLRVADCDEVSRRQEGLSNAVIDLINSLNGLPDLEQGLTRISCQKCTPSEFLGVVRAFEGIGEKMDSLKSLGQVERLPVLLSRLISGSPVVGNIMNGCILETLNRRAAADDVHHQLFLNERPLSEVLKGSDSAAEFLDLAQRLNAANKDVDSCEGAMDKLLQKLRKEHSMPRWEWKKVANEEYLLEVPTAKSSKLPHSWPLICQTKAVRRFRPPEAARGYDKVQCARETREAVSARCWRSYLELFATVASPLRSVVRVLVNLDCLAALARVSNLPGYTKPKITSDPTMAAGIQAVDARHPLTETLQSCVSYVPNDVKLGRGCDEIALVISGPNYGGKSSFARMTALLVIMAQVGSYVPALNAEVSAFDSIHARMGSTDAIAKGMSSLMVELAETSRILSTATQRSLVILDELGRGTSTHDGTAIAYATLAHLVEDIKCVSLFVTHYPMLATLKSLHPDIVGAYYMDYLEEPTEKVSDSETSNRPGKDPFSRTRITFLYKLVKGVASSSYGLNVARLAGIKPGLIEYAGEKARELENSLQESRYAGAVHHFLSHCEWEGERATKLLLPSQTRDILCD